SRPKNLLKNPLQFTGISIIDPRAGRKVSENCDAHDKFEDFFPEVWYSLKMLRVFLTSAGRFSVICDH
ncbi:MAG: hypothetical protein WCO56_19725, partial [Verrucomicrobiota bacterium]